MEKNKDWKKDLIKKWEADNDKMFAKEMKKNPSPELKKAQQEWDKHISLKRAKEIIR